MGSTSHNYDIKNGIGKYGGMVLRNIGDHICQCLRCKVMNVFSVNGYFSISNRKGSQHHAEESCFPAAIRAKQAKYITIVGIAADTF